MNEERDPELVRWFAGARVELDDPAFTERVLRRARYARRRQRALRVAAAIAAATVVWLVGIPLETAALAARLLSTPLLDLGHGWPATIAAPVNSVAALVVLAAGVARALRRRIVAVTRIR